MWRLPRTSGYSYLGVAAIRIDVHPAGETRPICHTHPTLSPRMVLDYTCLTWSTHSNISRSCQPIWINSLPLRRRALDTIHNMTADRSVGPYPASLPQQPMKQWGKVKLEGAGFTGPIYQHVIGTFNICSWGPTHRSLTDTGGAYNLEGATFPHHTLWPS
jgi:hypothetical protein